MPSDLTTDDIAGMLADTHARSYLVNGVRTTTLTTECLEMVLREILSLRADRDAAVAEAVRVERERCAAIAVRSRTVVGKNAADAIRRGE